MPLTNFGASAPEYVLASSTASSMAPSGGIGVSAGAASGCSISSSATRMIAFSSGAMRSIVQPLEWRASSTSSSSARSSAAYASARVNSEALGSKTSSSSRSVTSAWYRAKTAALRCSVLRDMPRRGYARDM